MKAGRLGRGLVVVLVLATVATACSKSGGGGGGPGSPAGGGGTGSPAGGGGSGPSVSIKNFAFDPSSLTVSAGQTQITVTNNDSTTHTFTLDDGSVDQKVEPGQTVTVTVDISTTTGWHCSIHPSMTGTLSVG